MHCFICFALPSPQHLIIISSPATNISVLVKFNNMDDEYFMKKALQLAARAKGKTSPNPMVGAVIVKGGRIIASDYHRRAGTPHAEALALRKAGPRAKGATLYINLEPCCHTEKRTPPCTREIISSGIKKVVVAMIDPNPKVSGAGLREIMKAGIETRSGIMEEEAKELNEVFIKYITKKRPFVILKVAQSLDGKIATVSGESKWITSDRAREYVHRLRSEVDAILVGAGTVKKDDPSLDCRTRGGKNPYRVIVDSKLRIPLDAKVLKHNDRKTIIATALSKSSLRPFAKAGGRGIISTKEWKNFQEKIERLKNTGIQVLPVKEKNGRVDLGSLMKELGKLQITSVMIEGGSSINASALSDGIVDKVMFFIAPKIIGGVESIPSIGGTSVSSLKNAARITKFHSIHIGNDLLIEGYL